MSFSVPDSPQKSSSDELQGDSRDYGSFFRATLFPLRRYLLRFVGSDTEAEDVAQEAYTRVYKILRERTLDDPRGFLYATARNLALDEMRHRSRSPIQSLSPATERSLSDQPSVENLVMAREEWGILNEAIGRLPANCRVVLLLRSTERLSHDAIARKLGIPRKTAEKRLYRAYALLHDVMKSASGVKSVVVPLVSKTGTSDR